MKTETQNILRSLAILSLLAVALPRPLSAATVTWEVMPDRDRATVILNQEETFAGFVSRVSPDGLVLTLGVPSAGMGQNHAPPNSRFFAFSEPRGTALGFKMKTSAFSFRADRPDASVIIINAYADPNGANWRPGMDAPAQPAPGVTAQPPASPVPTGAPPASTAPVAQPQAQPPAAAPQAQAQPPVAAPQSPRPVQPANVANVPQVPAPAPVIQQGPYYRSPIDGRSTGTAAPVTPQPMGQPAAGQGQHATVPQASQPMGQPAPVGQGQNAGVPQAYQPQNQPVAPPQGVPANTQAVNNARPAPAQQPLTDDKGNPIPVPPTVEELLGEVRRDIGFRNYQDALDKLGSMLSHPDMTVQQQEDVQHLYAEMLFMANQDNLLEKYDDIVSATIRAMNFNQESHRNAAALLRLGYVHLKLDNIAEAEAYFNRLRRQYPLDENIPLTYYYWGEYYFDRNQMQDAADQFQYIISNHAESRWAQDAALGLARAYATLGYVQEAWDITDYIERRWPRLYLESPSVLELMGDIAFRQGNLDFALDKFLTFYNLMPDGPSADIILTRIGDVYAKKRMMGPARISYEKAEALFPDRDGGLVAMMRLAEAGINDTPEITAMFTLFGGPFTKKPEATYRKIIEEHPDSALVPLAQLKLAMWHLWSRKYEDALRLCSDLVARFPEHELAPRAEEVAFRAFTSMAAEGARDDKGAPVVANWSNNPLIRRQEEKLTPDSRIALAVNLSRHDDSRGALAILDPLFRGSKDPRHGEEGLLLALNINVENDRWSEIERLATQVELWELTDRTRQQVDYALALSKENLGHSADAAPLWQNLVNQGTLPEKQQAYAEFFVAQEAERKRQLQEAYLYGRNSLNRFLQMARINPEDADQAKIETLYASLMDICETAGRFNEALEYANNYMDGLPEGDPKRVGMLFRKAGIYDKQGNTPEWRRLLAELVERHPETVFGKSAASALRSAQLRDSAAQFAPGGQL